MDNLSVNTSVNISLNYYIVHYTNQTYSRYIFNSRAYVYFDEGWIRTTEDDSHGFTIPIYPTYTVTNTSISATNIKNHTDGGYKKITIYYGKKQCKLTSSLANIKFTKTNSYQYIWIASETYKAVTNTITCGDIVWYVGQGL